MPFVSGRGKMREWEFCQRVGTTPRSRRRSSETDDRAGWCLGRQAGHSRPRCPFSPQCVTSGFPREMDTRRARTPPRPECRSITAPVQGSGLLWFKEPAFPKIDYGAELEEDPAAGVRVGSAALRRCWPHTGQRRSPVVLSRRIVRTCWLTPKSTYHEAMCDFSLRPWDMRDPSYYRRTRCFNSGRCRAQADPIHPASCRSVDGTGGADGRGFAWMVQRPAAEASFVMATQFGSRTVVRGAPGGAGRRRGALRVPAGGLATRGRLGHRLKSARAATLSTSSVLPRRSPVVLAMVMQLVQCCSSHSPLPFLTKTRHVPNPQRPPHNAQV